MGELDDDIARGCLPNGEPIEGRWGVGYWSDIPDAPSQEPDPWEEALSSARSEGYVQAINDAIDSFCGERPYYSKSMIWEKLKQLRSAYLAGGKDGKN
ncbi:MAG: hypothetical protein WC107_05760 [Patescibacteria group bacterium]|jgi:hypothetical protein